MGPSFSFRATDKERITSMRALDFACSSVYLWRVAMVAVGDGPVRGASTAKDGRVFEMRTYYADPGKLEALHARFRDHTTKLFEKHGMTNVGYWVPIDETDRRRDGNTLVYILSYPSLEARKKSWDDFQERSRVESGDATRRRRTASWSKRWIGLSLADRLLGDQVTMADLKVRLNADMANRRDS